MTNLEVLKGCLSSIEKNDFMKADRLLADEFQFSGAVPKPIGKQEWLGVHQALGKAFPDLAFNLFDAKARADKVFAKVRLSGTHKDTLDLSFLGVKVAATGKSFSLPVERIELTFRENLIQLFDVESVDGGGLNGILHQVGAALPTEELTE